MRNSLIQFFYSRWKEGGDEESVQCSVVCVVVVVVVVLVAVVVG